MSRWSGQILALMVGSMAVTAFAQSGSRVARPEAAMAQPSPCYAELTPAVEMTGETIKYLHEQSLKGKPISVAMRNELAADGTAAKVTIARPSGNVEVDEVAQAIAEVAAVKCAMADIKEVREMLYFSLAYQRVEGEIAATPRFERYIRPVLPDGVKPSRFCEVAARNDEGIATNVNCDFDGLCVLNGPTPAPRFPKRLNDQGRLGITGVTLTVNPQGKIVEGKATNPSGHAMYDDAALIAAKTATFTCSGQNPVRNYDIRYVFTY